jgi:hypothetical protein
LTKKFGHRPHTCLLLMAWIFFSHSYQQTNTRIYTPPRKNKITMYLKKREPDEKKMPVKARHAINIKY